MNKSLEPVLHQFRAEERVKWGGPGWKYVWVIAHSPEQGRIILREKRFPRKDWKLTFVSSQEIKNRIIISP